MPNSPGETRVPRPVGRAGGSGGSGGSSETRGRRRAAGWWVVFALLAFASPGDTPPDPGVHEGVEPSPRAGSLRTLVDEDDPRAARLWQAARDGETQTVASLLADGIDPDVEYRLGANALLYAARAGHGGVVRLLLEHGASVEARDEVNHLTALHLGAAFPTVVEALLDHGAPLDRRDLQIDQTPLGWAVVANRPLSLELMLTERQPARNALESARALAEAFDRPDLIARLDRALGDLNEVALRWPRFRGIDGTGVADATDPPVEWDAGTERGIAWQRSVPGLGHSSPVVWGDRIFLTTAVSAEPKLVAVRSDGPFGQSSDMAEQSLRLYCFDTVTGETRWARTIHQGPPTLRRHPKNSFATPTPATDGRVVVAFFGTHGLHAFDPEGRSLWSHTVDDLDWGFLFDPSASWGDGTSPILHQDLVILQLDVQSDSRLVAFDSLTGEIRWRVPREQPPSWSTPTVARTPAGPVLVTHGTRSIDGYDPATGTLLWSLSTNESVVTASSPVYAEGRVAVVDGYGPLKPIYVLRPDGRGTLEFDEATGSGRHVVWSRTSGGSSYISPLIYRGQLYVLSEGGVLSSYLLETGRLIYRVRLGGGSTPFSASPVAGDGRIYLASESGHVYVVRAGLEPEVLADNPTGEGIMASPAVLPGILLVRDRRGLIAIDGTSPETPEPAG